MRTIIFFLMPLLTAAIELLVWYLITIFSKKYKTKFIVLSIAGINILTNSLLQIAILLFNQARNHVILELGFEVIIIITEWQILKKIYTEKKCEWLTLSILMNLVSYGIGLILFTPQFLS